MGERPGRRPRRALAALAGAICAGLAAAGCAGIPSSGPVGSVPMPSAPGVSGEGCCALIVGGPQPGWTQEQVVSNFLLASASFADNHAIARKYLTPAANRDWRPGSAVTILDKPPTIHMLSQRLFGPGEYESTVLVTGEQIATLDPSGQYIPTAPGQVAQEQVFGLQQVNHRWFIATMPSSGTAEVSNELLLTSSLFHTVYQPRNLYFYATRNHALVPDPTFVPAGLPNQVAYLLKELLRDPYGLLRGAAVTAFPRQARLRGVQVVGGPGQTAIVDIGLPPGASHSALPEMAAQIIWTLTASSYSPQLFQSVKLELNGHPWPTAASASTLPSTLQVAQVRAGSAIYYIGPGFKVETLGSLASRSQQLRGKAGSGELSLNQIAVSPNGRELAGVAGPATTVYTAALSAAGQGGVPAAGPAQARLRGAGFSTPSFDSSGDLWVAGRVGGSWGVWLVPAGQGQPQQVILPAGVGRVTALRVAPDGVRIAMVVGSGASAHLLLGVIVRDGAGFAVPRVVPLGPSLVGVTALTWYDEDHLLAISRTASGSQLSEVPVDGDTASPVAGVSGMVSITADGPANPLYLGLSDGRLEKSAGLGEPWTDAVAGQHATYPG